MFSVFGFRLRHRHAPGVLLSILAAVVLAICAALLTPESLHLLAAIWILAILAVLATRSSLHRRRAARPLLLCRRTLREPPLPFPPQRQMRAELTRLLSSPAPRGPAPESPEHAIRRILERGLASQRAQTADGLSPCAVTEFWLLALLLRATPERAGGLARCFRQPDMVLDLHERVTQIAAAYAILPERPIAQSA
ncbi:hypothetical protein [Salipiger mangrovisoli]|uniref:DUF4129 domain-containing protein n=1 Tax=Salipiger mangrovisoli TaxID=2865933 RepID=A0ABR9X2B9_9RHOB|nr:hypothetical protein [Salipiger mangrovisoli]MBE9637707.1 hypothetical protein [Salipiger mangrovisoli]